MTERGTTEQRREHVIGLDPFTVPAVTHALALARVRSRVVVEGTVGSVETVAWAGGPVTEITVADGTDLLTLVFFGRHRIAGVHTGTRLVAAGTVVNHHGRRVIMSPQLWLTPTPGPSVVAAPPAPVERRSPAPLVPALTAAAV